MNNNWFLLGFVEYQVMKTSLGIMLGYSGRISISDICGTTSSAANYYRVTAFPFQFCYYYNHWCIHQHIVAWRKWPTFCRRNVQMEITKRCFKIHCNLILRVQLTISYHWFRICRMLGTKPSPELLLTQFTDECMYHHALICGITIWIFWLRPCFIFTCRTAYCCDMISTHMSIFSGNLAETMSSTLFEISSKESINTPVCFDVM